MTKTNHVCCLTGNKYFFDESNYKKGEEYKFVCDTKVHYDVYQVILKYVRGQIKKEDAKAELELLDTLDRDTYKYVNECLVAEIFNDSIPDRNENVEIPEDEKVDMTNYYTKAQVNTLVSGLTVDVPYKLSDLADDSVGYENADITNAINSLL